MKTLKIIGISCLAIFFIAAVIAVCILFRLNIERNEKNRDYTQKTSPLLVDVVTDICEKLNLPTNDERCDGKQDVHAPQLFRDIEKHFDNLPEDKATRDEVNRFLGKYQISCGRLTKDSLGQEKYRCLYDLQGDGVSIISIFYTKEDKIESVLASMGGS